MKERRRTVRYPFVATAELIDETSQRQLSVRVTELSLYGCYFDSVDPFSTGTRIVVKIVNELGFFEARGTVLYSQPHLGMGVRFEQVHPYSLNILHGWLREAEKARVKLVEKLPPE
jgi:PilZ domain